MKTYKIGIIGCGNIAKKMALTLGGMKHVERYAVASRSKHLPENGSSPKHTVRMRN